MKLNIKLAISIFTSVIIAFILIIAVFIFRSDKNAQKMKCDLYFLNETGTTLVAEEREIKYHRAEDLYENVVFQLINGPYDARNRRVIEKNTDIIDLTSDEEGSLVVNFSERYLTDDSTRNALGAYAVVKSLCELQDVERVKVVIEGNDLQSSDGSVIGYMTSEDINLPSDTYTSETRVITLYFPNRSMDMLYREDHTVQVSDQQPMEQYIISELIKGPSDETLTASLNSSTSLLSVDTYNDICFVNFKADFIDKNLGSEQKEQIAIYSIVNSLTELPTIKRVQFLMDGKKADDFGNISIKNPFGRNSSIIN